jgi:RHS repeat-associated protein
VTFVYDGDGTRFSRQVGGNPAIRYVSDVNVALPVMIDDGTRKYVYGLGLAYAVNGSALDVYHTDRLGSVRALTNSAGTVTAAYRSDEYGLSAASYGTSSQPFGFTGEPRDATGLSYLRARYDDPSLGRFISRDSWAGSATAPRTLQRFAYAGNNPATFSDPRGMWTIGICLTLNVRVLIFGVELEPICVVAASSLEVGITRAGGGGLAAGANASVGVAAQVSSGDYVEDLGKEFGNLGGAAEFGGGVQGSIFGGLGHCGQFVGGGTLGPSFGGGVEGHLTGTYTQVVGTFGASPAPCPAKNTQLRN